MTLSEGRPCTVCGDRSTRPVIEIDDVPVYCNVLYDRRQDALSAPRGNLHLAFCSACGHVFNTAFRSELLQYSPRYENSLHYSPRFQQYAEELAADLVKRHGLTDKTIVEIACGKGDFLRLLCSLGNNRGYGFDPSYEPEAWDEDSGQVTFRSEYYGRESRHTDADFLCCRHALEHIQAPTTFLRTIRESIRRPPGPVLFFEVPNSLYSFRDLGIWDLIYEHPSYFSSSSLVRAFELAGLRITGVKESFEGQFLCAEALPAWPGETAGTRNSSAANDLELLVRGFEATFARKMGEWNERAVEWRREGKNVAVWGAGSKGVTFLNALGTPDAVRCAVDVSPKKQGKFVPGTGHSVASPDRLGELRLDVIVVMNPNYRDEVSRRAASCGCDAILLDA